LPIVAFKSRKSVRPKGLRRTCTEFADLIARTVDSVKSTTTSG
jgi:hypothetical protein